MAEDKYRILHLSDFHWNGRKEEDQKLVVSELKKDLNRLASKEKIDLLVFSGDLVDRGQDPKNFQSAKSMLLDSIRDDLGLSDSNIILCPGNHDVDREYVERNNYFESGLRNELSNSERLNQHIDQYIEKSRADDPANLRLQNYFDFLRANYHSDARFKSNYVDCIIKDTSIGKIGFASFNSAWRSIGAGEVERHTLLMSERVIDRASEELKDCDLLIAIMHHPLEWLALWDAKKVRVPLFIGYDLVLFGHVHESMPSLIENTIGNCLLAQGGCLYSSREYFNGYQIIDVALEDGARFEFLMRSWFDYPRRSFGSAENICADGKKEFYLRLDNHSPAKLQIKELLSLQSATDEAANAHLRTLQLNNVVSFDESFTCPPLSNKTEEELSELSPANYKKSLLNLSEVLSLDGVAVLSGSRESGKTTIALKMAKESLLRETGTLKIPINVNFSDLKKYDVLDALVRRHITSLNLEIPAKRILGNHKCLFIVDNVSLADGDRIGRLQRLIKETSAQHDWVIFLDRLELLSRGKITEEFASSHAPIFILPFGRQEIRTLVTRISPTEIGKKSDVDTIIKLIDDNKLPRNAYIVTLLSSVMRNVPLESNINEATLLDSMIDLLLNKESPANIVRSSTDFTGLNILLEEIAQWFSTKDEPLVENEVLLRLASFLQQRGILEGAGGLLESFIKAGILERRSEEIHFRYRSFQSFFLARYAARHREFAPKLLEDLGIIKFSKEFSLLCDLSRKDEDLLNYLEVIIAELCPQAFVETDKTAFLNIELKGKFEKIVDDRITDISDGPQSLSKIDEIQDFRDRAMTSVSSKMQEMPSSLQTTPGSASSDAPQADLSEPEIPKPVLQMLGYLEAWRVWGRAITALDFVELSVRKPSFLRLLEHWARLASMISEVGNKFLGEIYKQAEKDGKTFSPRAQEYFEYMARVNMPIGTVQTIFSHIGSSSVHQLLLETYDSLDSASPEALGAVCMLIKQMPEGWHERVQKFIETRVKKNHKGVVQYFLLEALYQEYYYRSLDPVQQQAIEQLIALLLSQAGFVHQKKEMILAKINENRARIDLLTRDLRR